MVVLVLLVSMLLAVLPAVPAGPETQDAAVQVSNFAFTPDSVTIQSGEQVTWDWSSGTHSVETRDGAEVWCGVRSSGSCSKAFPTPGTYTYRCGVHPSSMLGTVIVEGETPLVSIDAPSDGASFEADFQASGTASHSAGIAAVRWRIDDGNFQPVDTLLSDSGGVTWSTTVSLGGVFAGTHTLTIEAEAADTTKGQASITFDLVAPDDVDLRARSLTVFNGLRSAQVHAQVENLGTLGVTGATLAFQYHYHGTWRTLHSTTLDLAAGQSVSRGTVWDSEGKIGSFPVRAILDPQEAMPESDESNNAVEGEAAFGSSLIPGLDPFEPV